MKFLHFGDDFELQKDLYIKKKKNYKDSFAWNYPTHQLYSLITFETKIDCEPSFILTSSPATVEAIPCHMFIFALRSMLLKKADKKQTFFLS